MKRTLQKTKETKGSCCIKLCKFVTSPFQRLLKKLTQGDSYQLNSSNLKSPKLSLLPIRRTGKKVNSICIKKFVQKTLVLDLDETLIHCEFEERPDFKYDEKITILHNGVYNPVFVKFRPFMQVFLEEMSRYYELIIFSASIRDVLISKKSFLVLHENSVIVRRERIYKLHTFPGELQKQSYQGSQINKQASERYYFYRWQNNHDSFNLQPGCGLLIPPFIDDEQDKCLLQLIPFLKAMEGKYDVRPVGWWLARFQKINGKIFDYDESSSHQNLEQQKEELKEEEEKEIQKENENENEKEKQKEENKELEQVGSKTRHKKVHTLQHLVENNLDFNYQVEKSSIITECDEISLKNSIKKQRKTISSIVERASFNLLLE